MRAGCGGDELCRTAGSDRYLGYWVVAYDADDFVSGNVAIRRIDRNTSRRFTAREFLRRINSKWGAGNPQPIQVLRPTDTTTWIDILATMPFTPPPWCPPNIWTDFDRAVTRLYAAKTRTQHPHAG